MNNSKDFNLREAIWLGLTIAGMLLTEIIVNQYATYQYLDSSASLVPLLVFGALTAGNLISLFTPLKKISEESWSLITGASTLVGILGLARWPDLGFAWMTLPFLSYGSLFSAVIGSFALITAIIGLAGGGLFLYILMGLGFQALAPYLTIISMVLPVLGIFCLRRPNLKTLRTSAAIAGVSGLLFSLGTFEPQFVLNRVAGGLKNAVRVGEPIYTPLIRTDLLKTKKGKYVIVTNGCRFAGVKSKKKNDEILGNPELFLPSYDSPYLFRKPKKVLIIGSAEGSNIRAAIKAKVEDIAAVDINPAVFHLMKGQLSEVSGGIYNHPSVRTITSEGRHFLETTNETFDLITLQGVQTGSRNSILNPSKLESYLLTKESLLTIWNRLSPEGMLWIDEYEYSLDEVGSTLVSRMAAIARDSLYSTEEEFKKNHALFRYLQNKGNPNGGARRYREGLLLTKSELSTSRAEIESQFNKHNYIITPPESIEKLKPREVVTDNKPFLYVNTPTYRFLIFSGGLFIFFILISSLMSPNFLERMGVRPYDLSQFFVGLGFILMVLASVGPLGLYLGDPQLATPVLFMTTYTFGLLGGLLAFKTNSRWVHYTFVGLALYSLGLVFIFEKIKPLLISMEPVSTRILIVVVLIAPLAMLIELPYVWIMNQFSGNDRSRSYTIENAGSLVGIPIGLWIQAMFGFSGVLIATGFSFLLGFVLWPIFTNRRDTKIFKWTIGGLLSAVVLPASFHSFSTQKSAAESVPVLQTMECEKKEGEREIDVGFKNAAALKRKKRLSVIVGPGDGCYKVDQILPLNAIKRNKKTRAITRKEARFEIKVDQIDQMNYQSLSPIRQKYLLKKFGPKARVMKFDQVTLTKVSR